MDSKETVQALMDSVQMGDFAKAKSLLSDDFTFSGPVPKPMGGDAWLGMSTSLKKGFPNLDYQFRVESVDGDMVKFSAELKGTHSADLDLTAMGLGMLPATSKSFANPHVRGQAMVNGDKVTSWTFEVVEGGGLSGILAQIGAKIPGM